jgi:hypothetical protein
MPKFHRNSDEYGGYSNEKSAIDSKTSKSVSSTSINEAKCTARHTKVEDGEESDDVDIDMVSATDSDVSFYVSLHGAFILIKIEFFLFKEFYC